MASRKDQLHSYQFMLQRVISAVVMRETDPAQAPLRRGTGAVFLGVMIAVIVAAVFGIVGIFTKLGSNSWQTDGTVIVERESGAVFVYQQGSLTPMLNYASALLVSGKTPPTTSTVPHNSLAKFPRQVTRGIPNAPSSLPDEGSVTHASWTLCSVPGQDAAGHAISTTTLVIGGSSVAGTALGDRGLVVRDAQQGGTYLIWHSAAYPIEKPDEDISALFGQVDTVDVGTAWLNGLSAGQTIQPVPVNDTGTPSTVLSGQRVGDVVVEKTGNGGQQYYLVLDDGLAPISKLQAGIQAAEQGAQPATELSASVINGAHKSNDLDNLAGTAVKQPTTAPDIASAGSATTCAVYRNAKTTPNVLIGADAPASGQGAITPGQTGSGTALADQVVVPPGHLAVVRAMASPTAVHGNYYLVTDTGMRYAVPDDDVLKTLGYTGADAVDMPGGLVARIPNGPELDPQAAEAAVDVNQASGN